jgi:molybdenum-dependent DNA-binding transcriptional regulator ModE
VEPCVRDRRGRGISAATLTAEELELLALYRRLPRQARATIADIAESLAVADQSRRTRH